MKYDRMLERNRTVSREKAECARAAIGKMLKDGDAITVTALAETTGLSRDFFYKNVQVREYVAQARLRQSGQVFGRGEKELLDKAMAMKLAALEKQLARQKARAEELECQNEKLKRALEQKDRNILRRI